MNWQYLHIFYHAAHERTFRQAAQQLDMTQSAVSQSVAKLEGLLETSLFVRHGKKLSLSEEGTLLYEELQKAAHHVGAGLEHLRAYRQLERGHLRIAASDTICRHYLKETIGSFHAQHPDIDLEILNEPSPRVIHLVQSARADLGFINGLDAPTDLVTSRHIAALPEVFFSNKSLPPLHLEDLLHHKHVSLSEQTSTRRFLNGLFEKHQLHFHAHIEVISIDLMIDLVESGLGIGFTHRKLVEQAGLYPIDLLEEIPSRSLMLIEHPSSQLTPSKSAFLATLAHFYS